MVTLHRPTATIGNNGEIAPVMPIHKLTAKKDTRTFTAGEQQDCYIAKMSDGRYQVFDATFINVTNHHECFTEQELHDSFDEASTKKVAV